MLPDCGMGRHSVEDDAGRGQGDRHPSNCLTLARQQVPQSLVPNPPTRGSQIFPDAEAGEQVVVVGDTHGQFHDVCKMLDLVGMPSATRTYVFNGDFVDRGAWGIEVVSRVHELQNSVS